MNSLYPKNGRVILHVDANAFFASVEIAQDPSLAEKAVVVAGKGRKGMVIAANYICKAVKGVYTTMPVWEVKKLIPDVVIKEPNHALYRETSERIFEYLFSITPTVEIASIDEAYLDITKCEHLGSPVEIAKKIQQDIMDQFLIPVSIGIAPNRFLAKMASDLKKPLVVSILRKRDVERVLWGKPVIETHGIGQKTADKLNEQGIKTMGDLAQADTKQLERLIGIRGPQLQNHVNGIDNRPVNPEANVTFKSIGNSSTFPTNTMEDRIVLEKLRQLSQSVSERMKRKGVVTYNVQLTLRYGDFTTITRRRKLETPVSGGMEKDLFYFAASLFRKHWNGDPVRLIGVAALDVIDKSELTTQLDLFSFVEEADKLEPILRVVDSMEKKYGKRLIGKGTDFLNEKKNK